MPRLDSASGRAVLPWARVARARERLLMLDYDGTLAAYRIERALAVPSQRMRAALDRLAGSRHTTLAIVSGRPVAELQRLLPGLRVPLVGEHGWEVWLPGEPLRRFALTATVRRELAAAARAPMLAEWRTRLERKRTAVVLHTRGLRAAEAARAIAAARTAWRPRTSRALGIRATHGGLELRAGGHDKGTTVEWLAARMGTTALRVFVGDDDTDEDAFAAVRRRGFGVRVGGGPRPTRAHVRLASTASVLELLRRWYRVAAATQGMNASRRKRAAAATRA